MGFNSVYKALLDVFPQVDSRLLRAVAIEHPKDADAAVEVVLMELIPYLSKQVTTPDESGSLLSSSEAVNADATDKPVGSIAVEPVQLDGSGNGSSFYDANGDDVRDCGENGDEELILLEKCGNINKASPDMSYSASSASVDEHGASDDHDQGCGYSEGENVTSLEHGEYGADERMNGHLLADWQDLNQSASGIHGVTHQEQSCENGLPSEMKSVVQLTGSPVQENMPSAPESSLELVVVPNSQITDIENSEPRSSFNAPSENDICTNEMVDVEDGTSMNTMIIRSGHICNMDLLEEIIEDARNNKKTLVSAMDSVISLMREVELQEKAAEQVKEEAAKGGLDILAKVDELKQALERAKEANDMHSGEVYAEKAILATEMKELQLRLLSLSEERDRSLGILDEMHKALEVRLTTAEKEMEAAELEKLEKEASAREALAHQECAMEKVVQESKILKQEAEENSKLQEFLMDRGRIVDMLQGEISVKCQDVKLLKEKFDRRVPLSKSLSSSQTTSILAASSSSSSRSLTPPEQESELAASYENLKKSAELPDSYWTFKKLSADLVYSSETLKTSSATACIDDHLSSPEEKGGDDDRKVLVDDGWEFFNNGDFDDRK